jgi:lipopolysaccharide export LptBFGC system permease protein LptF
MLIMYQIIFHCKVSFIFMVHIIYIYLFNCNWVFARGSVYKRTYIQQGKHTYISGITQHSTSSTMDINKYKNSNTSTLNIYKYNEHKQYNEHLKKKQINKQTNKLTNKQ